MSDPRWVRQLKSAVALNAENEALQDAAGVRLIGRGPVDLFERVDLAAKLVRVVLPYKFEGERHRILSLAESIRRGYGACGDATAALAAVVLFHRDAVDVCYESLTSRPGYAHVRIVIDGKAVDAFPDASLNVNRCSAVIRLTREGVGWPDVPVTS